ncbi:spore germination protein [Gracilibacillus caseinilyticus]|uniref:Spore germination protein n=1 Tax=Gracilibacillus caseinilyticus TaxID=2932256 RepID=A0ABY4F174_9BACI|nr:spore germination protein [Gracilibacillus caseinilyticus]UOQ50424.1 spore germination protein [Gracilibacillus caseinilyticus]
MRKKKDVKQQQEQSNPSAETDNRPIYDQLDKNIECITQLMGNSTDLITRKFAVQNHQAAIIFLEGLVDKELIQHYLLTPLIEKSNDLNEDVIDRNDAYQFMYKSVITTAELLEIHSYNTLLKHLLAGDTILLMDGMEKGFAIGSKGASERNVEQPTTQQVVRGPKDCFTESIGVNISLVRKRIKDPNLWQESFRIGRQTQTKVSIVYLNGIVSPEIVEEVKNRLAKIDVDAVLEGGYIEELIQDSKHSPFPTVMNSERPDAISAGILEGKVAIFVDGTPFTLLVPSLFIDFLQSNEDYYQRSDIATAIRLLRFLAFFLALLTPSLYVALTTFHQEMIPTTLLISLAAQREGIPFPAFVEALIMEVTFELLREAGIRLPNAIGAAISIVGALVLGQAAVDAGIVSATMVIVVSLTAISSFIFPNYSLTSSVRILRFGFMILAATLGLFGIFIGLLLLALHITSLRSFGVPYIAPFAPFIKKDQKDALVRESREELTTRPRLINQRNVKRQSIK